MCRMIAPDEWSCPDDPSCPRTTVRISALTPVISQISSSAVSGSITIQKVELVLRDEVATSPSSVVAVPVVMKKVVAPEVTGAESVVC